VITSTIRIRIYKGYTISLSKRLTMDQSERSAGIPFKSKLRPHVEQIRKWRRAGFTWAAIAEKLEAQGCKTRATNLCQFMRRYRRRPFPSEAGPETPEASPATSRPRNRYDPTSCPPDSMPKLTFLELAERILREENKPLSPSEIWKTAITKGYDKDFGGSGKTPAATLYSAIFTNT